MSPVSPVFHTEVTVIKHTHTHTTPPTDAAPTLTHMGLSTILDNFLHPTTAFFSVVHCC